MQVQLLPGALFLKLTLHRKGRIIKSNMTPQEVNLKPRNSQVYSAFVLSILFVVLLGIKVSAQSTMEYASLVSKQAQAAKEQAGNKTEESNIFTPAPGVLQTPVTGLYQDSAIAISKGSALLGQIGQGMKMNLSSSVKELENKGSSEKLDQKEEKKEEAPASGAKTQAAEVYLKSGKVLTGDIVEQTDGYVKISCQGVEITSFNEEIDKIVLMDK